MFDATTDALTARILAEKAAAATPKILEGPHGPGLLYCGMAIHHQENPLTEARNWVGMALSQRRRPNNPPNRALVFGLGLGWHLRVLKELYPNITVSVFEPNRLMKDLFDKYNVLAQGQEPEIFTDLSDFEAMVAREIVHGDSGYPVVMCVPAYRRLWPQEAARFIDRVNMELSRREVIDKTKEITNSATMDNLAKNISLASTLPDLMVLKDHLPTMPAFLVGAGPSLGRNGRLLAEVGDKGIILCAAAALKPLLALGVSPQVVLVLESQDTSAYLKLTETEKAVMGSETILACASNSHPNHFALEGFHQSLFHLNGGEAQLLSRGLYLPQGGNAGSATFALAYLWGLSPLILVGQDQAYDGNLLHAPGTCDSVFEENYEGIVIVPGIGGQDVTTNTSLLASVNWYVEAAATIKRNSNPPRLINATAHGASINGFEEISLAEVIKRLNPEPPKIRLTKIIASVPKTSAAEIKSDLKQMSGLISSLKRLLQIDFHRCLAEMVNTSQTSAFLAQILAPAMASGNKSGALKNLIWADGLILKMLSSL
ncbi:MAG: DUF115 domain-containing protein [Deltaproteobacteria bacterium]|jgi:hypothetical protein|nr:DUF115 domain-containing protein [Deltaproteobacteria bacterium]